MNFFKKLKNKKTQLLETEKKIAYLEKRNTILEKKLESNQEELTCYINKMFEKQEKERIINSIVNSIRQSLNLKDVLKKATEEIRKLLKYDKIIICIQPTEVFSEEHQVLLINNLADKLGITLVKNPYLYKTITKDRKLILSKTHPEHTKPQENVKNLKSIGINKYILAPIFFEDTFLGIMLASGDNIEFTESELDILEDFISQIAIAINHAQLYSEAQKHIQLKSEFIASMSHELRTPLNAIIGFSDLIHGSGENLNEKQLNYLKNISMSGKHLLGLINDILDLSKIESGNWDLNYEEFPHEMLVKEIVMILKEMAKKKNIKIELTTCSQKIYADSKIFRQILYNLINNAIKFTPEGGNIFIKSNIKKDFLHIEIEDTGIGISKKDKNKIFEQFSQADSSYTKKQEGTGLGLTLAKKFINLHGGEINFSSKENVGSKFWITIPIVPANSMQKETILQNQILR